MTPPRELPMLAGIANFIHWLEELANILNGPVLLAGMFIALIDLLTDGVLTVAAPVLLFVWAGSQALGIDTQVLACFARARVARGWPLLGWLVLGGVLGFAAWQAGYVFAVQQSQHISEAAALAQLHMDPALWLGWRAFLAVGLVALSGWTRYVAPATESVESERGRLERELTLEPLRAAVRARKALGWRDLGRVIAQGDTVAPSESPPVTSYTGAGMVESGQAMQHTSAPVEAVLAPLQTHDDGSTKPPTGPGSPVRSNRGRSKRRAALG